MYIVVVVAIVSVLVLGSLAAALIDRNSGGADTQNQNPVRTVTPGAEVARLQTQVAADPNDFDSLVVLAEILANSGRASEAIPLFEEAVRRRPDDPAIRLAFGRALLRTNNLFDAELQLTRAVELDPENQAAAFYLAQVYEARGADDAESARVWYQRAIDLNPDSLIAEQAREALAFLGPPATATP
ncbi:MAG: hypothetical protein DCC58_18415 [Chloroflexi bacterium]|nr:MAG: hypothetical protein DCC58_18415 [Chloroflexota bacterium]